MAQLQLRPMTPGDRDEVAELICVSTNYWYQTNRGFPVFPGGPEHTEVYFDVYETLDPGCGLVAINERNGRLMGSCFYHPRPTHVSLGIMNVHPNYFGQGVARALLKFILDFADRERKPVRLVSSALNLDSFSLYTRAGFVPRRTFQDVYVDVPEEGLPIDPPTASPIREATIDDAPAMAALEHKLCGVQRESDFRYFLDNNDGFWHVSVCEGAKGTIDGFMASCAHPGCNMIGPGATHTERQAAALIRAELDRHRGRRPVMLLPVDCDRLVRQVYSFGGRNCEMHLWQVRGDCPAITGVSMPTFLPETA